MFVFCRKAEVCIEDTYFGSEFSLLYFEVTGEFLAAKDKFPVGAPNVRGMFRNLRRNALYFGESCFSPPPAPILSQESPCDDPFP